MAPQGGEWGAHHGCCEVVCSWAKLTLMESSLGLQSSAHLPHCEYAILPIFLYYLLKIKMCLCVGGMRMTAGASSLEFESIRNVPGPMCFSRLTSPL